MKAKYKVGDKLEFELDGAGQKELFKEIANIQEIFGEAKCGVCGSENIRFVVRVVDDNEYYELRCMDCGAVLGFGQHKKGGTLFPKRKDADGNWLENRGWYKYKPPKK
jgi:DNA-directed RNA polymerase subunit RPC12/RpoP|tara:strand:- start:875 stop:1198 length:324 start_codon:yes stop_codon:yes gene_type:complete